MKISGKEKLLPPFPHRYNRCNYCSFPQRREILMLALVQNRGMRFPDNGHYIFHYVCYIHYITESTYFVLITSISRITKEVTHTNMFTGF